MYVKNCKPHVDKYIQRFKDNDIRLDPEYKWFGLWNIGV